MTFDASKDINEFQTDHDLLILLNERVRALTEAVGKKSDDHELRIRSLEQQRWSLSGGIVVISTIISYAISIFF